MIYVLIVLVFAILMALLYWQKQSHLAWLREKSQYEQAGQGLPENMTIDETETQVDIVPENALSQTLPLPFQYIEVQKTADSTIENMEVNELILELSTSNTDHSHTEKKNKKTSVAPMIQVQPSLLDESIMEVPSKSERETITLAEATRFLRRPMAHFEQDGEFQPDVIINGETAAPIITLDDPNIVRVRQRTRLEKQALLKTPNPTATQIATPKAVTKQSENNESLSMVLPQKSSSDSELPSLTQLGETEWVGNVRSQNVVDYDDDASADHHENKTTIELDDIQENLVRQRAARQRWAERKTTHQPENIIESVDALQEIQANEVWANLSKTHLPQTRRQRVPTRSNSRDQAHPKLNQAAENGSLRVWLQNRITKKVQPENGVAVAEPVLVPPANVPEPEIVKPVYFQTPNISAVQYKNHSHDERDDDENKTALQIADDRESHLSEADFAAYYQNLSDDENEWQNEEQQPITSWASTTVAQNRLSETVLGNNQTIPPLSLLLPPVHDPKAVQSQEELLENSITIEEKLAEYRVKVKVLDAYAGPVITRYEIEPDTGVRGNSVLNLEKDLARSLGVAAIRVVETIPGKTCMGLELPNPKRQMIRLSEVFNSREFSGSSSKLTLALGQDITGAPVVTDLAKAPHLLVAGTTGSGKSVGVNSMILSMLYKASPEDVRMIMIDPKMLELSIYEGIPHLLAPVITDMKYAANALTWCVNEMEKRYRLMSHVGVRNLAGYNQKISDAMTRGQKIANPFSLTPQDPEPLKKLPFIVVVVDEFADLMMVAGKQIEQLIARLAQKARAAGIHLILATQRPSVDVITGLIKANIPTRIAFQVSTKIDSRTILDQMGAENLLGQGDMLFLPPGTGYPQRVHGAFVADSEVHQIVEYLKQFGEPDYVDEILSPEQAEFNFDGTGSGNSERDPLFDQAVEFIIRSRKTSVSSLQRHLRIGYNKAAIIFEQLEAEGIISATDHSGKRTILARSGQSESQ